MGLPEEKMHEDVMPGRLILSESVFAIVKRIEDTINHRCDKLEDKIDHFEARMWKNFYFMCSGFAAMALMIAHGFKWF